jgi:hypothetical protein
MAKPARPWICPMRNGAGIGERSVAIFLLGLLFFSPIFLRLFEVERIVFGMPLLFIYMFFAWLALIALIAANSERSDPVHEPRSDRPRTSR